MHSSGCARRLLGTLGVRDMTGAELHGHFRIALRAFSGEREGKGLRALIEDGSVETFLTGLLFIRLHATRHKVSRESPLGNRRAADLTLHQPSLLHIELKQLNLKDGCKFAPQNLTNDLIRHGATQSLGIIYISDERNSTTLRHHKRFGGANRRAKHDVASVLAEFPLYFGTIFPKTVEAALMRGFKGHGGLHLYAFVVSKPLRPAT